VPNLSFRIQHVEPDTALEVRFREHLGLIARGTRAYEPQYVDVLRALLSPGDKVFDIGANIGFYSVLFSRWVATAGKVVAYEPDSTNFALLKRNLKSNRCENTVVREIALSNQSGEDLFSLDTVTRSTGHLGAGPTYGETIFGRAKETTVRVNTRTLDEEVELWGPPNLIKLDIEGGEFDVLCGGTRLLDSNGPFVISELNSWNDDKSSGRTTASLATELLCDHGYLLWDLDTGSRVVGGDVVWMILGVPRHLLAEDSVGEVLAKFEK
jgi:FkbM family methyltransferase